MNNDLVQKIARYKFLGWSLERIRRHLLLRKSVFHYLLQDLPTNSSTTQLFSHEKLLKLATTIDSLRPKSNVLIDQCPIFPRDLTRRAEVILENEFPISNKKVLFIGDDDLVSILISSVFEPDLLGLIDIDDRVLESLSKNAFGAKKSDKLALYEGNIVDIVDKKIDDPFDKSLFDFFVTDPPYTETGYYYFLKFGIKHLKFGGRAYIAIPYMNLEEWTNELLFKVEKLLLENGVVVERLIPGFAMYQHDENVVSSMMIAKKVSKPLLANKATMPSISKMYTTKYPVKKLDVDY